MLSQITSKETFWQVFFVVTYLTNLHMSRKSTLFFQWDKFGSAGRFSLNKKLCLSGGWVYVDMLSRNWQIVCNKICVILRCLASTGWYLMLLKSVSKGIYFIPKTKQKSSWTKRGIYSSWGAKLRDNFVSRKGWLF